MLAGRSEPKPSPSEKLLIQKLSQISPSVLLEMVSHFQPGVKSQDVTTLVRRNCQEVRKQAIEELFSTLLGELPEDKQQLLTDTGRKEEELQAHMVEDLMGFLESLSEESKEVLKKALDIQEKSPAAICEQLFINGLDAYLSSLGRERKLDRVAREFHVHPGDDDAIEQIIDCIFPPPAPAIVPSAKTPPAQTPLTQPPPSKAPPSKATPTKAAQPHSQKPAPTPATKENAAPRPVGRPPAKQPDVAPKDQKKEEIIRTRPPLQKGITAEDLRDKYWVDELKQFCKEHEIKCTGLKKAQVQKLVLTFLNEGQRPSTGTPAKRQRREGPTKAVKREVGQVEVKEELVEFKEEEVDVKEEEEGVDVKEEEVGMEVKEEEVEVNGEELVGVKEELVDMKEEEVEVTDCLQDGDGREEAMEGDNEDLGPNQDMEVDEEAPAAAPPACTG
eukprot:EG_transcript_12696